MKHFIAICAVALLNVGCATVSYSIESDDDSEAEVSVEYSGTSAGAKDLIRAASEATRRAKESKAASKTAKEAVKTGLPVNLQSSEKRMHLNSGGLYGYGYGQYGQGVYPVSQAVLMSEAATFQGFGRLPVLSNGRAYSHGYSAPAGRVLCPTNRSPVTVEERISCIEKTHRDMRHRVYKMHKRRRRR